MFNYFEAADRTGGTWPFASDVIVNEGLEGNAKTEKANGKKDAAKDTELERNRLFVLFLALIIVLFFTQCAVLCCFVMFFVMFFVMPWYRRLSPFNVCCNNEGIVGVVDL